MEKKCKHKYRLAFAVSFRDTLEKNTGVFVFKCKKCSDIKQTRNNVI